MNGPKKVKSFCWATLSGVLPWTLKAVLWRNLTFVWRGDPFLEGAPFWEFSDMICSCPSRWFHPRNPRVTTTTTTTTTSEPLGFPPTYMEPNNLVALDPPAKSSTFWGLSGKHLDFNQKLKSKDPTQQSRQGLCTAQGPIGVGHA